MELLRSAPMRFLAASAISVAAVVGLAGVCAAQDDRDGLTQPASYHGPFLTWSGKSAPPAAAPVPRPAPAPPTGYIAAPRRAPAPEPMPLPAPDPLPAAA